MVEILQVDGSLLPAASFKIPKISPSMPLVGLQYAPILPDGYGPLPHPVRCRTWKEMEDFSKQVKSLHLIRTWKQRSNVNWSLVIFNILDYFTSEDHRFAWYLERSFPAEGMGVKSITNCVWAKADAANAATSRIAGCIGPIASEGNQPLNSLKIKTIPT